MSDDEFADLVESTNSPAAKRIAELERELDQERQDRKQAESDICRALGERNDARAELEQIKAIIADPIAVHLNMLRGTIRWTPEHLRHLLGDTHDARAIIDATLKALPVGYIPAHTPESLPGRVADLVSELGRLTAMLEDPDEVELAMIRGDIAIPDREEFDAIRTPAGDNL
jgi:hypothetical protein